MFPIPDSIRQALAAKSLMGVGKPTGKVVFLDKVTGSNNEVPIVSCRLTRDPAANAQRCVIKFPNINPNNHMDRGYYSPDRGGSEHPELKNDWYREVWPGKNIQVLLGYGSNLTIVFTGQIDTVTISPDDTMIEIDCRDYGCLLLDQRIDDGTEEFYLSYESMDASYIVKDLLLKAGFPEENIYYQESGIIVDFIEFNQCTYADAICKLEDMAVFELIQTEDGKVSWQAPRDRQPEATEIIELHGFDKTQLKHFPISKGSENVRNGLTQYYIDADYKFDWKTGEIYRTEGSSIPDGGTVIVNYVYAAFVFTEGLNLIKMPYRISRNDVYGKVIINGDGVQSKKELSNPKDFGVTTNKIITENNDSIREQAKADDIATRYIRYVSRKFREVNFQSIGIPWLQVGDCIQILESTTTASEIYRISGLEYSLTPDGFTMSGSCYHYGYTG